MYVLDGSENPIVIQNKERVNQVSLSFIFSLFSLTNKSE